MWLGFFAVFLGMAYAVVKFFTAYHLRSLRDQLTESRHRLQKTRQQRTGLEERLQLGLSKKRTSQREVDALRHTVQQLQTRLESLLPRSMHAQIERCLALHGVAGAAEQKLLHELKLLEKVNRALEPLSLLLLRLSLPDTGEQRQAVEGCASMLEQAVVPFHDPGDGQIVAFFETPARALEVLDGHLREATPAHRENLRAALVSGVDLSEEESEMSYLLARNLHRARRLVEKAPPGTLLLNEHARSEVGEREDIEAFAAEEGIYALSWMPAHA